MTKFIMKKLSKINEENNTIFYVSDQNDDICSICGSSIIYNVTQPYSKCERCGTILTYYNTKPTLDETNTNLLYNPINNFSCKYELPIQNHMNKYNQLKIFPSQQEDIKYTDNTTNEIQTLYKTNSFNEANNYYRNISDVKRTTNQGFKTRHSQNYDLKFNQKEKSKNVCSYITRNNISHIVPSNSGEIGSNSETALESQQKYENMFRESLQNGYRNFVTGKRKQGCAGVASNLGYYYT